MLRTSNRMGVLLHLALRLVTIGFLFFCARMVLMEIRERKRTNRLLISSLAITTRLAL